MAIDAKMLAGVSRLALVGVAKNTGKTTTLNHLLASPAVEGRTVGLVSIGIDGEPADMLIGTDKPAIYVEPGVWVATARDALARSSARVEFVGSLGFDTPMGEVVVARVIEAGAVMLGGVRHRGDLELACDALAEHGADLVIIDGAYRRVVAAQPTMSDAVIVSTGAVISPHIDDIVAKTSVLLERLLIEQADVEWQRELLLEAIERDRCLMGGSAIGSVELPAASALLGLRGADELWSDAIGGIAVPGLVSDTVVEHLLALSGPGRVLLVPDGTVLQARARLRRKLLRSWEIRALRATTVLGIAVNPTSVQGHKVDESALLAALAERWTRLEIFNPLHSERAPL